MSSKLADTLKTKHRLSHSDRLLLQASFRRLKSSQRTEADRLESRRSVLKFRLERHNDQAAKRWNVFDEPLRPVRLQRITDQDDWDDRPADLASPPKYLPEDLDVELLPVDLPSSRGRQWCRSHPKESEVELALRRAHADFHLYNLRMSLVEKANAYRKFIRRHPESGRRNVADFTRATTQTQQVTKEVVMHVQLYTSGRNAMILVNWTRTDGERYCVLSRQDINVQTSVINQDDSHSWTVSLAWFWKMDISAEMDNETYLAECTLNSFVCSCAMY